MQIVAVFALQFPEREREIEKEWKRGKRGIPDCRCTVTQRSEYLDRSGASGE